jgi:hypothetical protein
MEAIESVGRVGETKAKDSQPSQQVLEFLQSAICDDTGSKNRERRAHLRHAVSMSVRVVPLDDNKQPVAEPFCAMMRDMCIAGSFEALTRDISAGGVSMYHTHPVQEKFLELELTSPEGERLKLILEVLRCRKTGPLYEIAGRFTENA